MKKNLSIHNNIDANCSAVASRIDSCAFAFITGVRYFSGLFYYSYYYYFRNTFVMRQKRRCAC